ncbi:hypothetical protein ACFL6T_06900, partial [Candidatus Zixiibacteriota bacterium]
MTEKSTPKKKFYRFRDPFDRDFTLRLKITILMGAWGFMAFYLWSIVLKAKIPDSPLGTICTIVAFLSPVLGWMYYDIIDAVVHRVFGQIFMP